MVSKDDAYKSWEQGYFGKPRTLDTPPQAAAEVADEIIVTPVTTDSPTGQFIPPSAQSVKPIYKGRSRKRGS